MTRKIEKFAFHPPGPYTLLMLKRFFSLIIILALASVPTIRGITAEETPRLGVWITIFSPEKVLSSRENADRLIDICQRSGINDIYLQVYRADRAHYDSSLTDRTPFEQMKTEAGEDIIPYLLERASSSGIRVHAWLNLLSLAHNKDANILKKYGDDVLTFDQHGRPSMALEAKDTLDNYYIRENQLFLEPGDWRVREYLGNIAEEVIRKYPELHGLHLDYIRYPAVVPFIPGGRFTSHGISYGYNKMNLLNFTKATGLDATTMAMNRDNAAKWDSWRRGQVTRLLSYISEKVRKTDPQTEISVTVVPSLDKTHLVTFQDWTGWLDSGLADSVILMNYTVDTPLMELHSASCLAAGDREKTQIGIGSYLLKDDPANMKKQIESAKLLSPQGVVLFSYDEVASSTDLQQFLLNAFGKK
jgi:uncharacterized lipoprotein YddW (UPF0748 family)